MRVLRWIVFSFQLVLAVRVLSRMARSAGGSRIVPVTSSGDENGTVSVIVPVLNEVSRLEPCLRSLMAQGSVVSEIIVVDGGSTDGTPALVQRLAALDSRLRCIDASPVPPGINGKAHNLRVGCEQVVAGTEWMVTIDADVRAQPSLIASLLAHAKKEGIAALSAATRQRVSGFGDGLLHPAMLTTLVYRFGIPGSATTDPHRVQANGQCMLLRRDVLDRVGGFGEVLTTVCEDVTIARTLAAAGIPVGFYEAGDLIEVEMYANWRETWANWSRSLPMRDRFSGQRVFLELSEVAVVQAAPLWLAPLARWRLGPRHPLTVLNGALAITRFGVLAGTRRAYVNPPASYWLSPVIDGPVAVRLWWMATRRRVTWRGRVFDRGDLS